ncbi:TPA: 50S ribosomal protein L17, partial [Candidatus Peregrinibacteria bacterium]|nr:50S ribosomal protein L17 [Candidatus Peregrinibacteria bacterium]
MRHRRKGSRLNRKSNQLKALLRNLVTSLVLNDSIITTEAKVKTLIPVFDRLVLKGRKQEKREAIRDVKKVLFGEVAQRKFIEEIVPA